MKNNVNIIELKRNSEKKEKNYPYNLLTNYNDTIEAMAEVEGQAWLNGDQNSKNNNTTQGAVEHINKTVSQSSLVEDDDPVYVVYGNAGVSRWIIKANGEVWFSEFHDPEKAKKAAQKGFNLFK
jgi:hypothetical protein